jgi:hypothetical protein
METVPEADEQSSRPATARQDPNYNSPSFEDYGNSRGSHEPDFEHTPGEHNKATQGGRQMQGSEEIMSDLTQNLQSCSWEELQEKFTKAMGERTRVEKELQKETAELLEVGSSLDIEIMNGRR